MGEKINKYLSGQDVCTLLNKDCGGPVGYYLIPNKKDRIGMVIRSIPVDVSVGGGVFTEAFDNQTSKAYPPEVFNILPSIKYVFVGNDLTVKIKENLPIEETVIGKTYKIAKIPYARSFLYLIKDFDKEHLNDFLLGLAFSIYIERQRNPEEEPEQTGGGDSGFGSPSFGL